MGKIHMTKVLLLICVLWNTVSHTTDQNKIDKEPSHNVITKMLTNIYTKAEKNLKHPDECMVCYEHFPVSLTFTCGHELCILCLESIIQKCDRYENCPKCRAPLDLPLVFTNLLTMINIYPCLITPEISFTQLQHAFPLICSAANLKTVIKCINMGVNVNKRGFDGKFPLTSCLKMDVMRYLVDKGADVNQAINGGATPLIFHSQKGNLQVVKYLFKKGAFINQACINGATPLLLSVERGHLAIVKFLVQNGANVNQACIYGTTPLLMSSQRGHLTIVQYLVENEADVNQATRKDKLTLTPLLMAIYNQQTEVAKFLIKKNANIEHTKLLFKKAELFKLIDTLEKLCKEIAEE